MKSLKLVSNYASKVYLQLGARVFFVQLEMAAPLKLAYSQNLQIIKPLHRACTVGAYVGTVSIYTQEQRSMISKFSEINA